MKMEDPVYSHNWPIYRPTMCNIHNCNECKCSTINIFIVESDIVYRSQLKLKKNIKLVFNNVFTTHVKKSNLPLLADLTFGNIRVGHKINDAWKIKRQLVNRVCGEIFNPELMTFKATRPYIITFNNCRVLTLFGSMYFEIIEKTQECLMCFDPVKKILFFITRSLHVYDLEQHQHFVKYTQLYGLTNYIEYKSQNDDMLLYSYDYKNFNSEHYKYPPVNCYFTTDRMGRSWKKMSSEPIFVRNNWYDVFMFRPVFASKDEITKHQIQYVYNFIKFFC